MKQTGRGAATDQLFESAPEDHEPSSLMRRTVHGGLLALIRQAANFFLRTISVVVIARLVTPEDFGLAGMVTAFAGILGLFRDGGLTIATVQKPRITKEQTSTLFWINLAIGIVLATICLAIAPFLSAFYHEPRLLWMTAAFGVGFIFDGAAAQHRALLQRAMRFGALTVIDTVALALNIAMGIGMGLAGLGYWTLVAMWIGLPAVAAVGAWIATGWLPGLPRKGAEVRTMLHFGGVMSLHGLVTYIAYNAEKVLLGRFWGAEVLGIYGRAYQLVSLPTDNLNAVMGALMFPVLARVQGDPERLRRYFLTSYSLFLALVTPVTLTCALFADDLVLVLLGPQWHGVAVIFRLLTPTLVAFALINPFTVMLQASGRAVRTLRISCLIAPITILGFILGLGDGAHGVALGFSAAMMALVVPVLAWSKLGTSITTGDIIRAAMYPLLSSAVAAVAVIALWGVIGTPRPPILTLAIHTLILFSVYSTMLLFVFKQWRVYVDLLRTAGVWPFGGN